MATKKHTKRRKRHLSSGAGLSRKVGRRRTHRKRGGLSEIFNAASATSAAKNTISGGIGGYGYGLLSKVTGEMPALQRGLIAFGASFLVGSVIKMPAIAAGISGAYGYELAQGGLNEMEEHNYSDGLNEMAEYMDEEGEPMYLAADGRLYYLDEMEEMEEMEEMDEMEEMADATYLADMYPSYANVTDY